MGSDDFGFSNRNARTSDYEGDVNVLFETALLSGVEAVLGNMITIVASVEDIGIIQNSIFGKTSYEAVNNFIDCLESL